MPNLELYSVKDNCVQQQAGLNWGFSVGHVSTEDAYIALTTRFFRENPDFFPNHGSTIITKWDDDKVIECLLEGTQTIDGKIFPKQISSYGDKSILGKYLRQRLGVSNTHRITMDDLRNYGRNYITVTYLGNNEYKFDFSV
ncbi:restriction endonuclease PLD domain-containing protein [Paraclostridium sordellii]|uniref:restriction endonuclease PLD domain-containing protein n=1 Tax=Paraclostridium sordellii TaxID=1505 RepID=UPI0005E50B5C|nr:restriction endonuclease PLD domain-containing protein [Paeniclostridium sordellii]CEQ27360.1 NgoFVII restriction endonuclease [[Clostridium] sordellii] [Paeniclostridium sordellii]